MNRLKSLTTATLATTFLVTSNAQAQTGDAEVTRFEAEIQEQRTHLEARRNKVRSELGCHKNTSNAQPALDKSALREQVRKTYKEHLDLLKGHLDENLQLIARSAIETEYEIRDMSDISVCDERYIKSRIIDFREASNENSQQELAFLQNIIKDAEQDGTFSTQDAFNIMHATYDLEGISSTEHDIPEVLSKKVLENLGLETSQKNIETVALSIWLEFERNKKSREIRREMQEQGFEPKHPPTF